MDDLQITKQDINNRSVNYIRVMCNTEIITTGDKDEIAYKTFMIGMFGAIDSHDWDKIIECVDEFMLEEEFILGEIKQKGEQFLQVELVLKESGEFECNHWSKFYIVERHVIN